MAKREEDFYDEEQDRPRVTDKRRVNMDSDADVIAPDDGAIDARPPASPELEERARAAETKLIEVQDRFDQLRRQLQREADETRQRLARSAEERVQTEKAAFLRSLLPVLDNLQLATEAAENGTSVESLLVGLQGTRQGFEAALVAVGAEAVPGVGAPFDPEAHEAVDVIESDAANDGRITAVYSRGYRIGNRLLRPARVQVGRNTSDE